MTKTIVTAAQVMSTTLSGLVRLLDDGVEATLNRERRELEQFRTRSKQMFDYMPIAISNEAEKVASSGTQKTSETGMLSVCLVTLLTDDYDGTISHEPGTFSGADVANLKACGKRLFDLLRSAGLRPSLSVENRFNRGNGKRYDELCLFIEVDPTAFK